MVLSQIPNDGCHFEEPLNPCLLWPIRLGSILESPSWQLSSVPTRHGAAHCNYLSAYYFCLTSVSLSQILALSLASLVEPAPSSVGGTWSCGHGCSFSRRPFSVCYLDGNWVPGFCAGLSLCLVGRGLGGGRRPWLALLVCLGKAVWFPGMVDRPKAHASVRSWQLQGGEAHGLRSLFSRL